MKERKGLKEAEGREMNGREMTGNQTKRNEMKTLSYYYRGHGER